VTGPGTFFARAEWRTRWRAHLALAAVVTIVVAAVLAALVGAARSEQAFSRLRAATHAADVGVFSGPEEGQDPETFDEPFKELRRYERMNRTFEEYICSENNSANLFDYGTPTAEKPDF